MLSVHGFVFLSCNGNCLVVCFLSCSFFRIVRVSYCWFVCVFFALLIELSLTFAFSDFDRGMSNSLHFVCLCVSLSACFVCSVSGPWCSCLFVCLFGWLFVCLFVCLSVCLMVCLVVFC